MMIPAPQSTSSPTRLSSFPAIASGSGGGNLSSSQSFPIQSSGDPLPPPPPPPPPSYLISPSSSYPPPSAPYYHHHHHHLHHQYYPQPPHLPNHYLSPPPAVNSSSNSGGGAGDVLMEMLTTQPHQLQPSSPTFLVPITPSAPPFSLASSSTTTTTTTPAPSLAAAAAAASWFVGKLPRGRHLIGKRVVYDIDVRLGGEVQPQLEVTPITKYVSDPGLVLGRQIAVNTNYICYGLKPGAIRILNIHTALRSLLRGHFQKVTDMAFFAEDVDLLASACLDGRVFVRKISEGPDEEEKPLIVEKILLSLKMIPEEGGSVHPRVCWHPHKQEILMVAIGKSILKIDMNKVGKVEGFSAEEPLNCPIDKLIDGVQLVGQHDGNVTDLSMCQWMITRLASSSTDGTVKVWQDHKAVPLVILRPHDGNPVYSVAFLSASHRPDHIVLITGGPRNQELKMWASAGDEGWLLLSDSESWQCSQTLTLESSAESSAGDAFFNQVVALPQAGLVLLANAKKNAIYAVHIEYGCHPARTCMDYIAEFTVTMPILSLTGTSDSLSTGEHIVQVYCVQTQAIQQYALDLSQCLPPPLDNTELLKTKLNTSHAFDASHSDGPFIIESSAENKPTEMHFSEENPTPTLVSSCSYSVPVGSNPESFASTDVTSFPECASSCVETRAGHMDFQSIAETISGVSTLSLSPKLSQTFSGPLSSSNMTGPSFQSPDHSGDQPVVDYMIDQGMDSVKETLADSLTVGDNSRKIDKNMVHADVTIVPEPPLVFQHPTHLVTPLELLSRTTSSSENTQNSQSIIAGDKHVQDVTINNDTASIELDVKVDRETETKSKNDFYSTRKSECTAAEKRKKCFYSQASDLGVQMARDQCEEAYTVVRVQQTSEGCNMEASNRPFSSDEDKEEMTKEGSSNVEEAEAPMVVGQSSAPFTKGKMQKGKICRVFSPSSTSPSHFNPGDPSNEPACNSGTQLGDAAVSQLTIMQDMLDQLMGMQQDMQKQMNAMISGPVSKEGKRLEASLGRSVEKVVKANIDALWARFYEANVKHEKLERECVEQFTEIITTCINKDLTNAFERTLKKEIATIGPVVARSITPLLEKSLSSAVVESFQRVVGDKAINQLEKAISSKLDFAIAKQLQLQFQTSGKQILQEMLRATVEMSIIPAFEMSCKAMFEQIDATFQKGLANHIHATQQQYDSTHSPLAIALMDAINSVSSIAQTLSGELADGQHKLIALAATSANANVGNPLVTMSKGPVAGYHGMAEVTLDPTTELSRLITEHKFEEAFMAALHRSDVSVVSWLCSQVDLKGMLSMSPTPLSQGVLLALLQQLACDVSNDTLKKVSWMTDVAVAINPADPVIALHVRPIFDQVYQVLLHQRNLSTTSASELASLRLLLHVINSVLVSCSK